MGTWSGDSEEPNGIANPKCPACKGAGFVHPRLPSGKPDYSRVVTCRCLRHKLDNEQQARITRYSSGGIARRFDFENFDPEGRSADPGVRQKFRAALEAALAFAKSPSGWLVLTGQSGSGKTHLAAAIASQRLKEGQPALYISAPDLLDHLRAAFAPGSEIAYDELFDRMSNAPVLILDDLKAQSGSPWAREKLEQLLNHRYNHRLPTVIVTATSLEEFEERVRSRLGDPAISRCYQLEAAHAPTPEADVMSLPKLKSMTFEIFDHKRVNLPPDKRENLAEAYRLARDYARAPEGWLVFQGENGCGKTHLAAAIANENLKAGKAVRFVVVPDFLDHLRSTFSPESKVSYDKYFEAVRTAPLLILDDFGEQSSTPWAQEKLYQVINYRYNAQLPTVITTCLSLEEIARRFSSRFVDPRLSLVFTITAPDYRGDQRPQRPGPARRHSKPAGGYE
ncbi:MAG: AAA family ATPase [Dehalococcoidia bacterium]|nr:MAG: AAA family ATPase [Dehalococcoidia bacterium]